METKQTEQTGMAVLTREQSGAMAAEAIAAKQKAIVEARYVIALKNPRDINQTRTTILDACKRPLFAKGARYKKPVGGGQFAMGFSIRFAEECAKAMKNIAVESTIVWEDAHKRNVNVTVTDLETNATYGDDITISKTVERKHLKEGQEKIGERVNSYGDRVFIVEATEDDMANKVNAQKSKIIRNAVLRLVPQDILEEAMQRVLQTIEEGGEDPKAELKRICDAFNDLRVAPSELARYLGHAVDTVSPAELLELRSIYTAINDGETSWAEVLEAKGLSSTKGPVHGATPEDKSEAAKAGAGAIDSAVIEHPYEHLKKLCVESGVTEAQVLTWMKSDKVKLSAAANEELAQCSDQNLRAVIKTWRDVLPRVRKVPTA